MKRAHSLFAAAVLILASISAVLLARGQFDEGFPHEKHARLFPLCTGCHEGIPEGNAAEFYPDPASCASCHDGEREPRVDWASPPTRINNLAFDHRVHERETLEHDGRRLECGECHSQPGAPRMEVEYAIVGRCLDCHAHEAQDHYVDADCATCHVPLAETRFAATRVRGLPRPPSHDLPNFLTEVHGDLAASEPLRCSTCHTRELCSSCHVNVAAVSEIGTIPPAGAALQLPEFTARYPVPDSHLQPGWAEAHGRAASVADCSTCHTQESCLTCHSLQTPRVVLQHPSRANVSAPGAQVAMRAPESHASAFFLTRHGTVAAARPQNCVTCHAQTSFCAGCHDPLAANGAGGAAVPGARFASYQPVQEPRTLGGAAAGLRATRVDTARHAARVQENARADTVPPVLAPVREATPAAPVRRTVRAPEFHPSNYLARHAAEAYAQRLECSNCHNTRLFCRDCHQQLGFGAVGRLGPGFHSAEPVWLFRHGQAARQTLESCTSCHAQQDCMQCHSELGAFQVSPHGRNFDARRAQLRNPQVCRNCHLTDPLGRNR